MSRYQDFKDKVLGTIVGDGQCVSMVVNNSRAYIEFLFPGVSWPNIIAPVVGAKDMAGKSNSYLQWIENDHNDPNQLPQNGDIMVFDETPKAGYTNPYANPYGHTGVCESADASGYVLLQQNSPNSGSPVNATKTAWKYRPCLGWYRPLTAGGTPSPTPAPEGKKITLPKTTGPWHLYAVGGPYNPNDPRFANGKNLLRPDLLHQDLTYAIDNNRGNGIYTITSQDYGQGDIWTNGSDVVIS